VALAHPTGKLNLPDATRVQYARNCIRLAVCEVKFPTLLELERECPSAFQKAMRKTYPHFERGESINLRPSGEHDTEARYTFRSQHRDWAVSLRSSAFSLESTAYENFEDFLRRLKWVVDQAIKVIDSDFFTRVGLRYVNLLPVKGDPTDWINADLVKPLTDNRYGEVLKYWQAISGATTSGNYNFRHGLEEGPDSDSRSYVLDFDFYKEEVGVKDLETLLTAFNAENFKLFRWAVGPKALEYLGKETRK
jgi:uncharacterized protein (TIGR04255 family)